MKGKGTPEEPGEATVGYALCFTRRGRAPAAHAIAHPQIDDQDPLAFFITNEAKLIINPKILRHTNAPIFDKEGCMSYPDEPPKLMGRYRLMTVEYYSVDENNKLIGPFLYEVKGLEARIWQHEIDHLNGKYVYDEV